MNPHEHTFEFCLYIQQCGRAVPARFFTAKGEDSEDAAITAEEKGQRICKRNKWNYGGVECCGLA